MSLWSNTDTANSKPKYANSINSSGLYDANDIYGVSVTETANSGGDVPHAGWLHVTRGVGTISSITVVSGGTLYANTDTVQSANGGQSNVYTVGTITTDANGTITAVTVSSNVTFDDTLTLTITTSTGSGANLVPVLGGRAGRIFYETLVAMSSISGDNTADNVFFPGT